jgi:hypothetical protein
MTSLRHFVMPELKGTPSETTKVRPLSPHTLTTVQTSPPLTSPAPRRSSRSSNSSPPREWQRESWRVCSSHASEQSDGNSKEAQGLALGVDRRVESLPPRSPTWTSLRGPRRRTWTPPRFLPPHQGTLTWWGSSPQRRSPRPSRKISRRRGGRKRRWAEGERRES